MEDFSQSRGEDDLFDDEIVPFDVPPSDSPERVAAQLEQISLESTSTPQPAISTTAQPVVAVTSTAPPSQPSRDQNQTFRDSKPKSRSRGGNDRSGRGGASGKRGAGGGGGGLADSKWAAKPSSKPTTSTTTTEAEQSVKQPSSTGEPQPEAAKLATATPAAGTEQGQFTTTTTAAAGTTPARPPAVRGDRTATGGLRKPKLTEEELSAKLAAAKERSQNVAAAYARAQADAANFEERERIANERREKDRAERRVMDKEREKNRQRKMAVMGGREWDAGKNEEDFKTTHGNGRGGPRRFQAGGLTPEQQYQAEQDDLRMYEWRDDDRGGRGRGGRGGRGRGGGGRGRGGGRGGRDSDRLNQQQPSWSDDKDFPALPGASSSSTSTAQKETSNDATGTSTPRPTAQRIDSAQGNTGESWAEQVESSEAGKAETA
ncbi:hypothetical protein ABEF91_008689 [Exophiala dermatitidis]